VLVVALNDSRRFFQIGWRCRVGENTNDGGKIKKSEKTIIKILFDLYFVMLKSFLTEMIFEYYKECEKQNAIY
jgi:hypothetical protein